MSAAAKKDDLPKLQTSLQEEINSPHRLKHAEVVCQNFNIWEFFVQLWNLFSQTAEKVSLPTAEDVKQEKTHQALVEVS